MSQTSSVSVVIPNWNGKEHLRTCLDALRGLEYRPNGLEVIVVDNGSTDGSVNDLDAQYPGARLIRNSVNAGFAEACNQGARASSAEYVAFLNNDCRVEPGWLRELVVVAGSSSEVVAVGSLVLDWSGTRVDFARAGLSSSARGVQLGYGQPFHDTPMDTTEQLFVNGAAMLARRDAFLEVGGFDSRLFAFYEDVDFGWRSWILGWKVLVAPLSRVRHRHHGSTRRLRPAQVEFLLTRNAIVAAMKNFEDAKVDQLLPIMILNAVAAIAEEARIQPERYWPPGFEQFAFNRSEAASPSEGQRDRLRLQGRSGWAREIASAAARRISSDVALIGPRGSARLVALQEVLHGWPDLVKARASVQERRSRPDAEIIDLFRLAEQADPTRHRASGSITTTATFEALAAVGLDMLLPGT